MALIKCPECGNQISDKALQCPNCGCPMKEQELKCPECGEIVSEHDIKCANCGYPLQQKRGETNVVEKEEAEQTTDPFAVCAFVCGAVSLLLLPIVLVPLGFIFFGISVFRINTDKSLKGLGWSYGALILLLAGAFWLLYCYHNNTLF